jgi:beta-lactamase class A
LAIYIHYSKSCDHHYTLLNETASCDDLSISKTGYRVFKDDLDKFISSQKVLGKISDVAVYFRDLKDGPDFGLNEAQNFISASLIKLPIAIGAYAYDEDHPGFLDKTVTISESDLHKLTLPIFLPPDNLIIGKKYSIRELIRRMLAYSDNDAMYVVIHELERATQDDSIILNTLKRLGLALPESFDYEDISVRQYAQLFRLLYNAAYLNAEHSNELLNFLSNSSFQSGLRAGVPKGFIVANKMGERILQSGEKQLHDCGIIYFSKNPYLLCILTRGKDFNDISSVIKSISELMYREIKSRRIE